MWRGWVALALFVQLICATPNAFNPPDESNTITQGQLRFALLDGTRFNATDLGCQSEPLPAPQSPWSIASVDDPAHRLAVASYPWGTSCLALQGGSLSPRSLASCGDGAQLNGDTCSVSQCDQRILIVAEATSENPGSSLNLLQNPSFQGDSLNFLREWKPLWSGYMPDLPRAGNDTELFSSIYLVTSWIDEQTYSIQGATQTITMARSSATSFYIGGYSKTYELTGAPDDNFGIMLDVEFAHGSSYGLTLRFPTGTHDWDWTDQIVHFPAAPVAMNVSIILREHTGAAWVDQVVVAPLPHNSHSYACNTGIFGDPRVKTIFNELYAFQTPGEYEFYKSSSLKVQTRHVKFGHSSGSLISAVALHFENTTVSLQFNQAGPSGWSGTLKEVTPPKLYVDHVEQPAPEPVLFEGVGAFTRVAYYSSRPVAEENAFVQREQGEVYRLELDHADVLIYVHYLLQNNGLSRPPPRIAGYMEVVVNEKDDQCGSVVGLVGNSTAITDPFRASVGPGVSLLPEEIIEGNARSWQIKESDSYFTYAAGYSSSSFQSSSTPEVDEVSAECEYWASVSCNRQALTFLNESCVEDVVYLQNNPFIVQNYHTMEAQLQLTNEPLNQTSPTVDNPNFLPDDSDDAPKRNYTLTVLVSVLITAIIIAIGSVIYRRKLRKRRLQAVTAEDAAFEMDDLLVENENTERFE